MEHAGLTSTVFVPILINIRQSIKQKDPVATRTIFVLVPLGFGSVPLAAPASMPTTAGMSLPASALMLSVAVLG